MSLKQAAFFSFFALLFLAGTGFSQKVLVLEKLGKGRHFFYITGDRILLETKKEHWNIDDIITHIDDTSIVVGADLKLPLTDIYSIKRIYKSRMANGMTLAAGGVVLISITSINNMLHDNTVVDPLYAGIGLGLIGAGVLWATGSIRSYKIKGLWMVKVLDSSILTQ